MKTYRFTLLDVATVVTTVVILAMALWVAMRAPDVAYPMQFNTQGEVNRWGDRNELAVLLGFMAVMTAITAGMMGWHAEKAEEAARRRSLRMGQLVSLLSIGGVTGLILWFTVGALTTGAPPAIGWAMALTGPDPRFGRRRPRPRRPQPGRRRPHALELQEPSRLGPVQPPGGPAVLLDRPGPDRGGAVRAPARGFDRHARADPGRRDLARVRELARLAQRSRPAALLNPS